ncbi:MAG: uncharacterized protein PWR13_78 [Archaeoglobi archaeon]|nr:uncharacterized protein [Archaeoglobi archaeon]MDK2781050.1 uncharacterized protein [Archaeoglobi archaeon]
MDEKRRKLTLIGKSYAREGFEFIFLGLAEECSSCRFRFTCGNLESNRKYRVLSLKNPRDLKPCRVHTEGVLLVEVEEAPLIATIESKKALIGTIIEYHPIKCDQRCPISDYCSPSVREGEKYMIEAILGTPEEGCRKGRDLKIVRMIRSG